MDDDKDVLRSLSLVLSAKYEVLTSEDPIAAVTLIRHKHPNVVVLDMRMPKHDGLWVLTEVRKFDPHVPVIINSAYHDRAPEEEARKKHSIFAYLAKGGSAKAFLTVVEAAILRGNAQAKHA